MTDRTDHQAILAHIAELSRNARANWFGLIGLCLFVGVTLLGHDDADFFAFGAETKLPLVNVEIPVKAFFVFAPLLVAALYIYLHLYLMSLWDALADAPPRIDGKPLADAVYPWLMSHAALWYRNRKRRGLGGGPEGSSRPRALGWAVVAVSLFLGWVFGQAVLGFLWFWSLPAHDEWLTLWTAACYWCAACVGWSGFRAIRLRMRREPREMAAATREAYRWVAGGFAFALFFLSWEATEGGLQMLDEDGQPPWLYQAKLAEAVLTRKPSGTVVYEHWVKDYAAKYREREDGNGKVTRQGETGEENTDLTGNRDFIKEAVARFNAPLDAPDLRDADLRQADMARAFLPGADLRGTNMRGAVLTDAEMQGANFWGAGIQGADLRWARLQGAILSVAQLQGTALSGAQLQGAGLAQARMQGAYLDSADMREAYLSKANMREATLRSAKLQGADLSRAEMQKADLRGAEMQKTNLRGANLREANLECIGRLLGDFDSTDAGGFGCTNLQSANFSGAELQEAVFRGAKMQGAVLSGAKMQGADLSETEMQGAIFTGAEMQKTLLWVAKMQGAVLNWAEMQGAYLAEAEMQGAVLRGAKLQEAVLRGAKVQGADLSGAEMQNADCFGTNFQGALLRAAIVTCVYLTQEQLELAVGDSETLLPEGLTVASCLESLPEDVEMALAYYSEESGILRASRAEIRDALLCDRDADGKLIEKPERVGRHPEPEAK